MGLTKSFPLCHSALSLGDVEGSQHGGGGGPEMSLFSGYPYVELVFLFCAPHIDSSSMLESKSVAWC